MTTEIMQPNYYLGYGLQAHAELPFPGATALYTQDQVDTLVQQRDELLDALKEATETIFNMSGCDMSCEDKADVSDYQTLIAKVENNHAKP